MCPLSFTFKRIHLSALRLYRKQIEDRLAGSLTPARVDMLRIIHEHEDAGADGVAQTRIQELLDVHPSVVSRMLKRLREIGYVTSAPHPDDLRCNIIRLTQWGVEAIDRYLSEMGLPMEVQKLMSIAFFGKPDTDASFTQDRRRLYRLFNRVRLTLRDCAPFLHPWTIKDVPYTYNYTNPQHPFQVEHWSPLRPDDDDDVIASVLRCLSPTPRPVHPL